MLGASKMNDLPCLFMHAQRSYVVSEPYSRVPGDRNWRHRVVDIDLFVSGPLHMLPRLQEVLKGKNDDLHGLTVSRNVINF